MDIHSFSVGTLDSIFYIPSFLTSSEQAYFLHQVNSAPASKWKTLKNRRLQNWGGVVHEKGLIAQSCRERSFPLLSSDWLKIWCKTRSKSSGKLILTAATSMTGKLPPWLTTLTKRIFTETGLFPSPINHVLVNEYEPGQGIMPHQDGPLYFPVVAIVSLGSPTVMRFVPHQSIVEAKEEIPPNSTGQGGEATGDATDAQDGANNSAGQCMPNEEKSGAEDMEKPSNLPAQQCKLHTFPKDASVILMPGSLLLFKDSAYLEYLHGIEDSSEHKLDDSVVNAQPLLKEQGTLNGSDFRESCTLQRTGTRISLTCRLVPKVQGKFLRL